MVPLTDSSLHQVDARIKVMIVLANCRNGGGGNFRLTQRAVLIGDVSWEEDKFAIYIKVNDKLIGETWLKESTGFDKGGRHLVGLFIVHVKSSVGLSFQVVKITRDGWFLKM